MLTLPLILRPDHLTSYWPVDRCYSSIYFWANRIILNLSNGSDCIFETFYCLTFLNWTQLVNDMLRHLISLLCFPKLSFVFRWDFMTILSSAGSSNMCSLQGFKQSKGNSHHMWRDDKLVKEQRFSKTSNAQNVDKELIWSVARSTHKADRIKLPRGCRKMEPSIKLCKKAEKTVWKFAYFWLIAYQIGMKEVLPLL